MKPEKQLYQWDVNQYLTGINPAAQYVDYTIGNEVIRIKADGTRCRIPDEVLQTYGGKTCYERYSDGTFRAYSFSVLYAPKPPDYIYTPEERTTFEALTARVDAAIDEIKRRADSGEFTPKKGVDYFTDAEKAEMMESVSDGAIGEFRKVVDTATTEYNVNHTEKMTAYDTNASEKLTTYDTNAEQHTTDYNRNAAEKQEAYNQNHTEKVAEYNANAETKTAEFDSNAAALQEQMAEKANVDGYYEEMTVGDAEQLIATQFVEDNEPYLFRPTGGSYDVGNRAYIDKIVGGTVVWNQLVDKNIIPSTRTEKGLTFTNNGDGSITVNGTAESITHFSFNSNITYVAGHKYLLLGCPSGGSTSTYRIRAVGGLLNDYGNGSINTATEHWNTVPLMLITVFSGAVVNNLVFTPQLFDLTQMFGTTIADYIYSLEQSQAGAGVAWFKKLFPKDYYPYNAGELLSVEGLQSHDTVGFNQWDGTSENGRWISDYTTGAVAPASNIYNVTNLIRVLPNTAYYHSQTGSSRIIFYDSEKNAIPMSGWQYSDGAGVITTPQNARYVRFTVTNSCLSTFCINLNSPSRNGEYEPYEKHSYPLDNSLTMRGIPKLDASNNLYYDGDEYASDGKVKRKYGVVDLGTLNWQKYANISNNVYYAVIRDMSTSQAKALCSKFVWHNWDDLSKLGDGMFQTHPSLGIAYLGSKAHTDATAFKNAMNGVMLVYELATPTTETAEPFQNIQIVDDFGTEEFVSTGIVPAGHVTRYPANLRDKLQHLPSLASADGTYLIQQSGKQMSLIHMPAVFPEIPTEDGTYTLKTVVTGGVATLQWVVE